MSFLEHTQVNSLKFEIEFKDCGIEFTVSTILKLLLVILWALFFKTKRKPRHIEV